MRKLAIIGCWLLMMPMWVASLVHVTRVIGLRSEGPLMDANPYFDPVIFILNYLTPVACIGAVALPFMGWRGLAGPLNAALAVASFGLCTTALLLFLYRFYAPFGISNAVWWLSPVVILWLVGYAASLTLIVANIFWPRATQLLHVLCVAILLVSGAILAWLQLTNDFSLSETNIFAVVPLILGGLGLIKISLVAMSRSRRLQQIRFDRIGN